MSLLVLQSGILDTVQDTGRYGYARWGINPGGAMDRYAAQVANFLVGNSPDEAVVEIHFPAFQVVFHQDTLMSITGGDFEPSVDSIPLPLWKPVMVKKDAVLSFQRKRQGYRCYLAVHGGFDIPKWLGSTSTNVKIRTGGFEGRSLKKGDVLSFRPGRYDQSFPENGLRVLPWSVNPSEVYAERDCISFTKGNEWSWLTAESKTKITDEYLTVHPTSDRMACYFQPLGLTLQRKRELLSSAVTFGTMQLLPNGELVILMADHQTTGGYPCIGHVASAHLPKLSQCAPLEKIRLKPISTEAAEKMLISLREGLQQLEQTCRQNLDRYYAQR